jgi:hypothetical protein
MAVWLSVLGAAVHAVHGSRREAPAFALLELACLACGALEAGAVESGVPSRALMPSRIAMTVSAVAYVAVLAFAGRF